MQKSQASIYFILFIANCFVDTINLEHCIYGSLYLVHYLNQYVCNRQDVSLFLHSSPCVNSMFPQMAKMTKSQMALAWDATAQIMPIFIRKMARLDPTDSQYQSANLCSNSCVCNKLAMFITK